MGRAPVCVDTAEAELSRRPAKGGAAKAGLKILCTHLVPPAEAGGKQESRLKAGLG